MPAIKRKRITQVGSGAYAVYLPKKWIDAWGREQREKREVDLHLINNSLLLVPALRRRTYTADVPTEADHVRMMLLSAYVRGHHEVTLRPAGGPFPESCVAMARDFLRHLDERLLTTVRPEQIGFTMQPDAPPSFASGGDLLRLMLTKLQEMVSLAAECVEAFGVRPERAVHTAQLLASLQEEDLSRLYRQALRLVANLDLPVGTVSEFQFLDLVAGELETMGAQCVAVGHAVVAGLGISPDDLDRPRADLARRAAKQPEMAPVLASLLRVYGRSFDDARTLTARLAEAVHGGQTATLLAVIQGCREATHNLNRRVFATLQDAVGDGSPMSLPTYTAYQVRHPTGALFASLGRAAERAASLSAAQETVVT